MEFTARYVPALISRFLGPENAFGLHLNPELPRVDAPTVLRSLRAFLCLYDELTEAHEVDPTRSLSTFIDPFPNQYALQVLDFDSAPELPALIEDYLAANPTRSRSLPELEGLILGGGADVDPQRYNQETNRANPPADPPRGKGRSSRVLSWILAPFLLIARRIFSIGSRAVDRERDTFEEACLTSALEAGIPVLGICRGAQFINIHCGGSLYTDLAGFYGEAGNLGTVAPRKRIRLQPGSRLHTVLGDEAMVNSLHRQAVNRLGAGLAAIAHDDAGVIQAIEHGGHPFLSGVQWHPDYLPAMRDQQRIFQDLVTTAQVRHNVARREVRVQTNQVRKQPLESAVEREVGSGNPDRR